ncbi:MAG: hypothetical protein Kapaf2KO_06470 [Candidatus Kapaibacteriales bacterium]
MDICNNLYKILRIKMSERVKLNKLGLPESPGLRKLTIIEGISLLLLLLVAMPLKYMAGIPEAVSVVGMAHGVLFIVLMIAIAYYCSKIEVKATALKVFIILFFAAFLPLGWMIGDRMVFGK